MYNLAISGNDEEKAAVKELFGDKYDLTEDLSQANVLAVCDDGDAGIPDSRLLFAVCDLTADGMPEDALICCADHGVCVFRDAENVKNFIENGNVTGNTGFPDIDLGPFGNDASRIVIMMKGIDDPVLLSAMMFSGMDVRAVAGGLFSKTSAGSTVLYGCALVALREPVTRIPHVDGVLKVRVLQDI